MSADIEVKVSIPPRRRSATIAVDLDDLHSASAVVNAKSIRLTVRRGTGYGSNAQAVTLPRDAKALVALKSLLEACVGEISDQEEFKRRDDAERGGVPG